MSHALLASAQGASFLVLTQVASRASTFLVNQALLRYLSPALLGASVQLELFSISVLYFARESLRVALQRETGHVQAVVNVAYIPLMLGLPLTIILGLLYANTSLPDVPYILPSLGVFGYATCLELLSEPYFAVVQQKLLYSIRAKAETLSTIIRCFVTFGIVFWAHRSSTELGVLPFAFGQLAYAALNLAIYRYYGDPLAKKNAFKFSPTDIPSKNKGEYIYGRFSRSLCTLGTNLYLQSAVKYVLTQGDSLIITTIATLQDQGAYALASNYGGLIARMLFQPIEESSRNLFAKLCANDEKTRIPKEEDVKKARDILMDILKFYNLIGVVAFAIGPVLAPQLLRLVAGSRWSDTGAGDVLATYCYYIPLLAINGVTEAFVAAVASPVEVQKQSAYMGVYFVAFASAAFVSLQILELGAHGLVLANCLNMLCRIIWNTFFIRRFFARRGHTFIWQDSLPNWTSIAFVGASVAVAKSGQLILFTPSSDLMMLIKTGAVSAGFVAMLLILERDFIVHCHGMLIGE